MNHITRPLGYGPHIPYPVTAEVRGDLRRMVREQIVELSIDAIGAETPAGALAKVNEMATTLRAEASQQRAALTQSINQGDSALNTALRQALAQGDAATLQAAKDYTDTHGGGGGGGGGGLLLDLDGVPYFIPGTGGIELDSDGTPYFTYGG